MLYRPPPIDGELAAAIQGFEEARADLSSRTGGATRWLGSLRRQWRAEAASSSIEIEGFTVPEAERVPITTGRQPVDAADADRMALSSYARAMDHVGVMARDPDFVWSPRVLLDLHFDACFFQRDRDPGSMRTGGIVVTGRRGGPPAFVGPDADAVPGLVRELCDWLDGPAQDEHVVVRAALAHLNLVSIHPFRDGNGRVSRIVQSLCLALDGLTTPELLSIEEHLGEHTDQYYAALQACQQGGFNPELDTTPWLRFCLEAHTRQAERRAQQIQESARRWSALEALVADRGWPDRLVIALEQSLVGGLERAAYAGEAEVSNPTATNDLRRLQDAGLIRRLGAGPSTRYTATDALRTDAGG